MIQWIGKKLGVRHEYRVYHMYTHEKIKSISNEPGTARRICSVVECVTNETEKVIECLPGMDVV